MIQNFITLEDLRNFATQIIVLVIITEFTKRFWRKYFSVRTKFVVFIYSLILVNLNTFANLSFGKNIKEVIISIILNAINALIISYTASASYSKIIANYEKRRDESIVNQPSEESNLNLK